MIKLSIIIPAYNVEEYIERAINSVLNQNFNDYEIIVVEDKSTDNKDENKDDDDLLFYQDNFVYNNCYLLNIFYN